MNKKRPLGIVILGILSLLSGLCLLLLDMKLLYIGVIFQFSGAWFGPIVTIAALLLIMVTIGLFIAWAGVFYKKKAFLKYLVFLSLIETIQSIVATIGIWFGWSGDLGPLPYIFGVSRYLGVLMTAIFVLTVIYLTRPKVKELFKF